MTTAQQFALTLIITFFALLANLQAQTPRMQTVNIRPDADKVHISAIGDVYEMRVDVADEEGDVVFQSGVISDQTLDWNMRDTAGERVAAGTYLVPVTFRNGAGKSRKRVEQVTVEETEKPAAEPAAPQAVQTMVTTSNAGVFGSIARFTGESTIANSVITQSATGKIGIGTTTPGAPLTVFGTADSSPAITAANNATGGIGIKAVSTNATGIGVWGTHSATTGVTPGVKGEPVPPRLRRWACWGW